MRKTLQVDVLRKWSRRWKEAAYAYRDCIADEREVREALEDDCDCYRKALKQVLELEDCAGTTPRLEAKRLISEALSR